MSSNQPDWTQLLCEWWGGGLVSNNFLIDIISTAANIVVGGNPPYQLSDFLSIYPKFGTFPQAVQTVAVANGGTGYAVNDVLTLVQPDASGATVTVTSVTSGVINAVSVTSGGTGYSVASALPVTGGTGTGATFNITAIVPGTFPTIPQAALQLYINLAAACLQFNRWSDQWQFAMGLFVAHYATLWEKTEGNPGTTATQIATSGLAVGLRVSQAAGDVSEALQYLETLNEFGAWALTAYGQQLATMARIVGMGPMYIY